MQIYHVTQKWKPLTMTVTSCSFPLGKDVGTVSSNVVPIYPGTKIKRVLSEQIPRIPLLMPKRREGF